MFSLCFRIQTCAQSLPRRWPLAWPRPLESVVTATRGQLYSLHRTRRPWCMWHGAADLIDGNHHRQSSLIAVRPVRVRPPTRPVLPPLFRQRTQRRCARSPRVRRPTASRRRQPPGGSSAIYITSSRPCTCIFPVENYRGNTQVGAYMNSPPGARPASPAAS